MNDSATPPTAPVLTSAERRRLRAAAHSLDAIVSIGRQGLSASFLAELDRTLTSHELIKLRVAAERDERPAILDEISQRLGCAVVGVVGKVAVLFRPAAEEDEAREGGR